MEGIDRRIACPRLNTDPLALPKQQQWRPLNAKRYEALQKEVKKLLNNGFIKETTYPKWVVNPILSKKSNGDWRVCIDFTNLNKAYPKNNFPLSRIVQMVNATAEHKLLSFMDAYFCYNHSNYEPDQRHTSFIINRCLYCYKMILFGLKNAEATYEKVCKVNIRPANRKNHGSSCWWYAGKKCHLNFAYIRHVWDPSKI